MGKSKVSCLGWYCFLPTPMAALMSKGSANAQLPVTKWVNLVIIHQKIFHPNMPSLMYHVFAAQLTGATFSFGIP